MNSMAKVTVQLTNPVILEMRKDVRVTFADTLSNFGKTWHWKCYLGPVLPDLVKNPKSVFWSFKLGKNWLLGITKNSQKSGDLNWSRNCNFKGLFLEDFLFSWKCCNFEQKNNYQRQTKIALKHFGMPKTLKKAIKKFHWFLYLFGIFVQKLLATLFGALYVIRSFP